jgi:hypothetical protein
MSTDGTPDTAMQPAPSVDPRSINALARELQRYELVGKRPDASNNFPVVTEDELRALADGLLTRSEVTRLQRYLILEMLARSVPLKTIRQRLVVPGPRFERLVTGILSEGMSHERVDEMRAIEKVILDSIGSRARMQFDATGKSEYLTVELAASAARAKLYGLNKPVQIEVTQTRRVGVEIQVITRREEIVRTVEPPPLSVDPDQGGAPQSE